MKDLLIFGGTTEGRRLAEFCESHGINAVVSVATEYGDIFVTESDHIKVITGRMDEASILEYIEKNNVGLIIDATHPYAEQVTKNIVSACTKSGICYKRLIRKSEDLSDYADVIVRVDDIESAVEYLQKKQGNILITTGSNELSKYKGLNDSDRLYVRVLPTEESIRACTEAGINKKNIIAMQGPFSKELNEAMQRQYDCRYMVTKESGTAGGYKEKIEACAAAGTIAVVIARPVSESGESLMEICSYLQKAYCKKRTKVCIAGTGMGDTGTMTEEVKNIIADADVLIGGERLLKAYENSGKKLYKEYKADAVSEYISSCASGSSIVVLMSGDVGFYSGTKRLLKALSGYDVRLYPGISSVVYLAAKLGMTWQDMVLCSVHGRRQNVISKIISNHKVFLLSGNMDEIHDICKDLIKYNMTGVEIYVGERLSYSDEHIWHGDASGALKENFDSLSACVFINSGFKTAVRTPGIPDSEFIRGKVPMTKEEIRTISISKLKLTADSVIYDIGAGTGSVSVEMARIAEDGMVYAIEKEEEAAELIEKNAEKFCMTNIKIIHGTAPEAIYILPAPTHAFIGGTSGRLRDIIVTLFEINPDVRIVVNAVTLETVSELSKLAGEYVLELLTVNISRASSAGEYNLMKASNPVTIAVIRRKD